MTSTMKRGTHVWDVESYPVLASLGNVIVLIISTSVKIEMAMTFRNFGMFTYTIQ